MRNFGHVRQPRLLDVELRGAACRSFQRPGGGAVEEGLQFSRGRMEMSGRADCIPSAPGEMEAILTPASADRGETNTILVRWMISILHVQHLFLFWATMGTFIAISSEMIRDVS